MHYQKALESSGYKEIQLEYEEEKDKGENTKKSNCRKRNILWYNPPFNLRAKTNIGRIFLNLIEKHFPPGNILHKIFNKNTIKISYSCMDNFEKIIKKHNSKIIRKHSKNIKVDKKSCNCRDKKNCPIPNNCTASCVVYQATVSTIENTEIEKHYIGISKNPIKSRIKNHCANFNNETEKKLTSLSTFVWELKKQNYTPRVKWKIIKRAPVCATLNAPCHLCIAERIAILTFPHKDKLLNRRSEIGIKCRHKECFLLKNISQETSKSQL